PDQLRVERVPPLGLVQRDAQDAAVAFDAEAPHAPEHRVTRMLRGAVAAALTPLRDGGEALDEEAFAPYVDFLAAGGLDGLLALGTTGEGVLLPHEQRMRAARSEEHTSELQSPYDLVCRLLLEKKK